MYLKYMYNGLNLLLNIRLKVHTLPLNANHFLLGLMIPSYYQILVINSNIDSLHRYEFLNYVE